MKRFGMVVASFVLLTIHSACTYQSDSLSEVRCDVPGQVDGQRQCKNGVWTQFDANTPDLSADIPDMRLVDMRIDMRVDMPPDMPNSDMSDDLKDMPDPTDMMDMRVDMRMDMMPDMNDMSDMSDMNDMPDMPTVCGDSVIDGGEVCDDGNAVAGDGCDDNCQREVGWSCAAAGAKCTEDCGDSLIVGDEQCDDGDTQAMDGCSNQCQLETGWDCPNVGSDCEPRCGDGLIVGAELCDDNNNDDDDGCDATCVPEQGWDCTDPLACVTICGDGMVLGAEMCDDDNTTINDGCDDTCRVEAGWMCDGAMPSMCTIMSGVGNGQLDGNEECDDRNTNNGDGCDDAGKFENGYFCPVVGQPCRLVTGASISADRTLTGDGGQGGSDFGRSCPDGYFIVGVKGQIHSNTVGETTFICGKAEPDNNGRLRWTQTVDLNEVASETSGSFEERLCANDRFMNGIKVWEDNDLVRGFELRCAHMNVKDNEFARSNVSNSTRYGKNQGQNDTRNCGTNELVWRVSGKSGSYIDRIRVHCGLLRGHECGDGRIDITQACDDTNVADGDGCNKSCEVENNYTCSPQLLPTGSDGAGAVLSTGSTDLIWSTSDTLMGAQTAALVTDRCTNAWVGPSSTTKWINNKACNQGTAGNLFFHAQIEMPTNFSADALLRFGLWADDDIDGIYLNNVSQNLSFGASYRLNDGRDIMIDGFQAGVNTLSVDVNNLGGQGGMFLFVPVPYFSKCMP